MELTVAKANERTIPLLKALTSIPFGSRRQVADAIKHGRVSVNGVTVTAYSHPVDRQRDTIAVDGQSIKPSVSQQRIVLMLNKPPGILSASKDDRGRTTVIDILPPKYRDKGLYPVGRLDKDSTGLLLITNDGDLTYHLTHPKFEHEKEYLVSISGSLRSGEMVQIRNGILLDDGMSYPASIKPIVGIPPYNYRITIHEGRKRQLRRMFEKLGYRVNMLKRIRMGNIKLGELNEGKVWELPAKKIDELYKSGQDK